MDKQLHWLVRVVIKATPDAKDGKEHMNTAEEIKLMIEKHMWFLPAHLIHTSTYVEAIDPSSHTPFIAERPGDRAGKREL